MRKTCFLIVFIFLFYSVLADNVWTVKSVPNTRLQSDEIHVSDPDGFLSDSIEMEINAALCAICDKADVFVVTLASIGEAEPKRFATELFNYWGIGNAETDNGVLLLFVEDQHALEFETGYGAEGILTDAQCQRIFTNSIVPFFRVGDYEGGLCSGVAEIVDVFDGEVPIGLKTTLPDGNNEGGGEAKEENGVIFMLFAMIVFALPIVGIVYWARNRKTGKTAVSDTYHSFEENGATYVDGLVTSWSGSPWEGKGCLGGLTLGFSVFVILFVVIGFMSYLFPDVEEKTLYNRIAIITLLLYLTWVCFRQSQRALKTAQKLAKQSISPKSVYKAAYDHKANKIAMWMAPWLGWAYSLVLKKRMEQSGNCTCPQCGDGMGKYACFNMPENHVAEEKLEALKFTPYRCGNGHVIVVREHGKQYAKFSTCAKCGAYTSKLTKTETIKEANYSQSGEKVETYVCQHCGDIVTKTIIIPKKVNYSSSSSSSSSSSHSHSSHSSSSGGSFGGGRSGGGGYSGRW